MATGGRVGDRERVGDRIEHAIENRADAEREIAIGIEEARRRPAGSLRRSAFWLALTGISLYLVAPSVIETLGSWRDVEKLAPWWVVAMVLAQAAAMVCLWALQRIAIRAGEWRPIAT